MKKNNYEITVVTHLKQYGPYFVFEQSEKQALKNFLKNYETSKCYPTDIIQSISIKKRNNMNTYNLDYEIKELFDDTIHQFDFENLVDIKCCVKTVSILRAALKKHDKIEAFEEILEELKNLKDSGMECLPSTFQKIMKVNTPSTDY